MSEQKTFTIFTGTYNSGNQIQKVFKSLINQSFTDYEWIVIDDNSQDDTPQTLNKFIKEHPELDITFIKNNKNQGVALNRIRALEIAKGKYFTSWDHDDEQNENQLNLFNQLFENHKDKKIGFILAKCQNQLGQLLGKRFPKDVFISNYIKIHNEYFINNIEKGIITEHQGCMPTELNRKLLSEITSNPNKYGKCSTDGGDLWGLCAYLGYDSIFTNFIVRKYFVNFGERVTMSSASRLSNSEVNYYSKLLWVNYFNSKLGISEIKWKLRTLFAVSLYGIMSGFNFWKILTDVKKSHYKFLTILFIFPARILSKKYSNN